MARIVLHRHKEERALAGHPWIYRSEIDRVEGDAAPGDVVQVLDARGKFLGRAHLNLGCQIAGHILTRQDEPVGSEFWHRRLQEALARRASAFPCTGRPVAAAVRGIRNRHCAAPLRWTWAGAER